MMIGSFFSHLDLNLNTIIMMIMLESDVHGWM